MFYILNDKRVKNVYDIDDIDDIPYLALYYVFIDEDIIDNSMEQKEEEIETEKELEIPKNIQEYLYEMTGYNLTLKRTGLNVPNRTYECVTPSVTLEAKILIKSKIVE